MNSETNFSIPYRNQIQFNLNVPITTDKLAVQFQRPQPIFIERISLPEKQVLKTKENADRKKDNSLLLENTMSVMTQLARRDIQRGNTQSQIQFSHYEADVKSRALSSPQHSCHVSHKSSVRRQRLHHPVTVRESERNRVFGAVQTPPPAKPSRPLDYASKPKQRPTTVPSKSQLHSRLLKDKPASSNMKTTQLVSKDIFQVKSNLQDDSFSMSEDSRLQCQETSNFSLAEESRDTDISVDFRPDMWVSDIHSDAVAMTMCDLPSLENIKLRLMEMQREKQEIQQRWSSLKFLSSSQNLNLKTNVHVIWSPETDKDWSENHEFHRNHIERLVVEEPILFTKPVSRPAPSHGKPDISKQHLLSLLRGKKLLKLKQTSVEKILQNQHQFEKYLKSISHHSSDKLNPWQLIEELSDDILMDCIQEVGKEIESINEEIAHLMFTSEFLVDKTHSKVFKLYISH